MANNDTTAGDLNYADTPGKTADARRGIEPMKRKRRISIRFPHSPTGKWPSAQRLPSEKSVSVERLPWVQAPHLSPNPEGGCGIRCSLRWRPLLPMCRCGPHTRRFAHMNRASPSPMILPAGMQMRLQTRLASPGSLLAHFPNFRMQGSETFRQRVGDFRIVYQFDIQRNGSLISSKPASRGRIQTSRRDHKGMNTGLVLESSQVCFWGSSVNAHFWPSVRTCLSGCEVESEFRNTGQA